VEPFAFSLMLALAKVEASKSDIIESLLGSLIHSIFEVELHANKYLWIRKCMSENERRLGAYLLRPSRCRLLAVDTHVTSLVELIFHLLDISGVRMTRVTKPITLKDHVSAYASEMLRDLFRHFATTCNEIILNKLTERIFSSLKLAKSAVYIDQLSMLIASEPASSFQNYFNTFKSKLDHMIYMSPSIAVQFLTAVKPLLKYDSKHKEELVKTLQKTIYQNELDIRKVGLNGFVSLLTSTRLSAFLPSSQASQSFTLSQSQSQLSCSSSRIGSLSQEKGAESKCLEIFLSLRRCLSQQVEIRASLYQVT
jgi:hypothetical protein